jgi:uncharacterized membrane protein
MASGVYGKESTEFDRGIQFFDAIYGFAITLLITTVHLPPAAAWRSLPALLNSGLPSELYGFVLSFIIIAMFWRENYLLLSSLKALDSVILVANIVCAFFIVLINLTTQALHSQSISGLPLPVALFALNITLASASQVVMITLAERRGLTVVETPRTTNTSIRGIRRFLVPAVFLVSIPIAFIFGAAPAQYFWASLLVFLPLLTLAQWGSNRAKLKVKT